MIFGPRAKTSSVNVILEIDTPTRYPLAGREDLFVDVDIIDVIILYNISTAYGLE